MIGRYIYLWLQKFYWPILRVVLFHLLYKVEVADPYGMLEKTPSSTIIVSNHKTPLDPFIISILFSWFSFVYPIRFMAEFRKFDGQPLEFLRKIGIIYIIYFLFGAFSSRRGQGIERALKTPSYFLNHKQSVLIFPEGSMIRGNELGIIHRGAGVLAVKTCHPILPVAIKYRRGKYRIQVGKLFYIQPEVAEADAIGQIQSALQSLFQAIPETAQ